MKPFCGALRRVATKGNGAVQCCTGGLCEPSPSLHALRTSPGALHTTTALSRGHAICGLMAALSTNNHVGRDLWSSRTDALFTDANMRG